MTLLLLHRRLIPASQAPSSGPVRVASASNSPPLQLHPWWGRKTNPRNSLAKSFEHPATSYGANWSVRCCAVKGNGGADSGVSPTGAYASSPGDDGSAAASPAMDGVTPEKNEGAAPPSNRNAATSEAVATAEEVLPPGKELWISKTEGKIERAIFDFRFLTLMAVAGSLAGSLLCFLKGCGFVCESFIAYFSMCLHGLHTGKVILRLVEAVDVYLVGTVMLIFGMGLYGLFINNVSITTVAAEEDRALKNTTLFGMFALTKRPLWMRISSLDALKTKLGHVIVMILLVKMFEKSKTVHISSTMDLLYYSISIFLSSASLYVLQRLHP